MDDTEELFAMAFEEFSKGALLPPLAAEPTQARPDRELHHARATEKTRNRALHTPHKLAHPTLPAGA
jgi:hypothetical protein